MTNQSTSSTANYSSTLMEWFSRKGIAYENFTIDMVQGVEPSDEKNWTLFLLPADPVQSIENHCHLDYSASRVVGVSADGRAALFQYARHDTADRGFVDFISLDSCCAYIDSMESLNDWFESKITSN